MEAQWQLFKRSAQEGWLYCLPPQYRTFLSVASFLSLPPSLSLPFQMKAQKKDVSWLLRPAPIYYISERP